MAWELGRPCRHGPCARAASWQRDKQDAGEGCEFLEQMEPEAAVVGEDFTAREQDSGRRRGGGSAPGRGYRLSKG